MTRDRAAEGVDDGRAAAATPEAASAAVPVTRRRVLRLLAAAAVASAAGACGQARTASGRPGSTGAALDVGAGAGHPSATGGAAAHQGAGAVGAPADGAVTGGLVAPGPPVVVSQLPQPWGRQLAWTVDDGVDTRVVDAYLSLSEQTGLPLTFFPNMVYPSWREHADRLRPLLATGQVQVGNHTWSHPDLTRLSDSAVREELQRNHEALLQELGMDPRPWWRPPYGAHDRRVDAIAASLGYTRVTMWDGSLGDARLLRPQQLLAQADRWLRPGRLVIAHANHRTVVPLLPELHGLVVARGAVPVTLATAFHRQLGAQP